MFTGKMPSGKKDIETIFSQPLITLREKTMIRLLNDFTDLPDWPSKGSPPACGRPDDADQDLGV